MDDARTAHVTAVAALAEPTRRRLYDHVVRQADPVSRDEAAAATDVPRATAAFHLDRLVADGLLDVVFERRTGRTGPGAGRPAKLYRRAECSVTVSLPERHYDLAGRLLAEALLDAESSGTSPRAALERRAHERGAAGPGGAGFRAPGRAGRRCHARELPVPHTRPRAHRAGLRHEPPAPGRRAPGCRGLRLLSPSAAGRGQVLRPAGAQWVVNPLTGRRDWSLLLTIIGFRGSPS
jgi:DNA-binding transcriptional ArsR family regulator